MARSRAVLVVGVVAALLSVGCGAGSERSATAGTGSTHGSSTDTAVGDITIAAASDLRLAFEELGASFEEETGTAVTFSFGSSGQLAEQVVNGAPFDVFASANVDFVDEVVAAGRADGSTKETYAFGRLVVFSPGPGGVTTLDGLAGTGVRHVAIANPDHAPYGVAADQALRSAGVHDTVSPKLVLGENVSDTLRLATTGNADAAIVALSLVKTSDEGSWALVDETLHDPLEQALVVTGVDPAKTEAARAFVAHVSSPDGREVMNRHGFVLPDESPG
jgi:molybdate transport system substrate-binding protein